MWFPRSKFRSKSRVHNEPTPKFGSSSFKDAHSLVSDDAAAAGDVLSPRKLPIFHRSRTSNKLLRTLSQPTPLVNEAEEQVKTGGREIRIPGAEDCVVMYFTSLRVVRRTFEDCNAIRSLVQPFRVPIDERDISIDSRYADELREILGISDKSKLALPKVFIGGKYVGGAEEMRRLFESGELHESLESLPAAKLGSCEACGGMKFILCQDCNGSHKCYSEKSGFRSCTSCNESGLIRCPCSPEY